MDESYLIQNIKFHLVQRWIDVASWHIDDVLAMAAAMIYPVRGELSFAADPSLREKRGSLSDIHKSLMTFLKKQKRAWDEYTYTGLMNIFKEEWLSKLGILEKRYLAKGISLIDVVYDDGFINLKPKENVWNAIISQGTKELNVRYGNNDYEIRGEQQINDSHDGDIGVLITNENSQQDVQSHPCIDKLEDLWRNKIRVKDYKQMPLVWKLAIPFTVYQELKECLKGALEECANQNTFLGTHAEKLLVYVAEWYHWEYNGNNAGNNAGNKVFEDIGFSKDAQAIWEGCNPEYKEKYAYRGDRYAWLYSMYILGGFPLKYMQESDRFDTLICEMYKILDQDIIDENTINERLISFDENNTAYTKSLSEEKGSLRLYVGALQNNNDYISKDDNECLLVKHFRELIKNGRRDYKDFFKPEWLFYTSAEEEEESKYVECTFRLGIGYKKDNSIIPNECVQYWGIDVKDEFVLVLEEWGNGKFNKRSRKGLRYSKTYNSSYIGWGNRYYLSIDVLPNLSKDIKVVLYNVEDYYTEIIDSGKGKPLPYDIKFADYHQLYTTGNPYEWSTRTRIAAPSALIYSRMKYRLNDGCEGIPMEFASDDHWHWLYLREDVTLIPTEEEGQKIEIYYRRGSLEIEIRKIANTICYHNGDNVLFYPKNEEQPEQLPLLLGRDGITGIALYRDDAKQPLNDKDVTLEYRQGGKYFEEWTSSNNPSIGKIQVRVSLSNNDTYGNTKSYFYLPKADCIRRNLRKHQITFTVASDVHISVLQNNGEADIPVNGNSPRVYDDSSPSTKDIIPVKIGTKAEYAIVEVYRARKCRELYANGRLMETKEDNMFDDTFTIPEILLRDKFEIRTIDENGVKRIQYSTNDFAHKMPFPKHTHCYYDEQYRSFSWNIFSDGSPIESEDTNRRLEAEGDIIFQSLIDCTPNHYMEPIYSKKNSNMLKNKDYKYKFGTIINCFKIASEHGIYYLDFLPLQSLLNLRPDKRSANMIDFFKAYCECKNWILIEDDYKNLHRFAHECKFDWMLLKYTNWRHLFPATKRCVVDKLFRTSPFVRTDVDRAYINKVIELYWAKLHGVRNVRNGDNSDRKFMYHILTTDLLTLTDDERIAELHEIYSDRNICLDVYNFINNNLLNR